MKAGNKTIRFALFIWVLFCSALVVRGQNAVEYNGPKEKLHVYLLIGQSNMAGRAPFSEADSGVIDRCLLLDGNDQWVPASNPLNRCSTIRKEPGMQKMNPGYSFAKAMLKNKKGISVGLVVNARGGTKIEQWSRGGEYYSEAVRRAQATKRSGILKGVLWHQGEGNSKNPDGYLEKLEALVEGLRADLNQPALPFIAGQIYKTPAINDQIARLPDLVPRTGFAGSQGLSVLDRWHFDTESIKLLGERYAEEMLRIEDINRTSSD